MDSTVASAATDTRKAGARTGTRWAEAMPLIYYILRGDRDRWVISTSGHESDGVGNFRTHREAYDTIKGNLESRGMVVGELRPTSLGFLFEANPGPPLYDASASRLIEGLKGRFGVALRRKAVEIAKSQGRALVIDDDVWEATEKLVGNLLDEGPDDE